MIGSLYITRPHRRKAGHVTGEWLRGSVSSADAADEAQALLNDPRDTIIGVYFWADRYGQFDGKWNRRNP